MFLVVAGGNPAAQRHFEDTIQRKRNLEEVRRFLPSREIENLERIYHGSDFIVWGAVAGPMNESRWAKMAPGDVVLIYNSGRIRFAGEIAAKVRNVELARYFWRENETGSTWELIYFIVNEERTNVPIETLNPLFGYQPHYHPQGFSMISEAAVSNFAQNYGEADFVFPSFRARGRVPLSASIFVADHLRPAARKAGVQVEDGQRFGFHNLRHSLSNWLVNKAKIEPKTVQGILRHSKIQTTLDLYTREDGDETRAAQGKYLTALRAATRVLQ